MQNNSRYSTAHYNYNAQGLDPETMRIITFKTLIKEYINFRKNVPLGCLTDLCSDPKKTRNDIAVFSGAGGYLYLYIRLYQFFQSAQNHQILQESIQNTLPDEQIYEIFNPDTHLQHAFKQFIEIEKVINKVKDQSASFLMSNSAIYYMGALLCYYKQDPDRFQVYVARVKDYYNDYLRKAQDIQFELLYGVPGYLFIILSIQKIFNDDQMDPKFKVNFTDLIYKLCYWIVQVGLQKDGEDVLQQLMNQQKVIADYLMKFPFYKSTYLGGAHGISGVVHILIQADEIVGPFLQQKDPLFHAIMRKASIDSLNFVGGFLEKNDNIPSSINNINNNQLYQFCHGVPGLVAPLIKCYQLYKDNNQLERAKKCAESIWKYGMLKKGPGLCHGIAGNSYGFMYLYNLTKDVQYLQKAYVFVNYKDIPQLVDEIANFAFKDRFVVGSSDNPYSLYLGIAGNMCAQMDFLQFKGFPGYDI